PAILTINNISDESHSKPLSEEEPELDDCYITDYSDFEQILLVEEGLKLHKTDSVKGERYLKLSADSKNEKAVTLAQKL
ncbi:11803_t:CDS:2, partial [Gigaspora rosea]